MKNKLTQKIKQHKKVVLFTMITVLLFVSLSYAWYVILFKRDIESKENEVMAPYYLYLLNKNADDFLQLTIGNLHPGEVKQEVICVSNKEPGNTQSVVTTKDSTFSYEFELAHTCNLPITYKVYELLDLADGETSQTEGIDTVEIVSNGGTVTKKKKLLVGDDVSDDRKSDLFGVDTDTSNIVNAGEYLLYRFDFSQETRLQLTAAYSNGVTLYENDYYLIEIEWNEGIQFSNYTKETDLIYAIVKALQAEPEEIQGN